MVSWVARRFIKSIKRLLLEMNRGALAATSIWVSQDLYPGLKKAAPKGAKRGIQMRRAGKNTWFIDFIPPEKYLSLEFGRPGGIIIRPKAGGILVWPAKRPPPAGKEPSRRLREDKSGGRYGKGAAKWVIQGRTKAKPFIFNTVYAKVPLLAVRIQEEMEKRVNKI